MGLRLLNYLFCVSFCLYFPAVEPDSPVTYLLYGAQLVRDKVGRNPPLIKATGQDNSVIVRYSPQQQFQVLPSFL
jgi:hypothetical protein